MRAARRQVAEPLTHRAEIDPGLQEVRGRGMPDHVWPNVLSFELRRGAFELEHVSPESLPEPLPSGKSFAGSGEEEEVFVAGSGLGSSFVEVDVEHGGGGLPEGTDSGFAPFADEGDFCGGLEPELVKSDSDGFADATARVVPACACVPHADRPQRGRQA